MNIYVLENVLDNPLYEGLASLDFSLGESLPSDWRPNWRTWEPKRLKPTWRTPDVVGNVRHFNDYPGFGGRPAFSQRAVDLLRDLLEPNGELLPLRHKIGIYYYFNCTCMSDCLDLERSKTTKVKGRNGGVIADINGLVFNNDMLEDLTIFRIRTLPMHQFCSQRLVDRVKATGLQAFSFTLIWPLPEGVKYYDNMSRKIRETRKWTPKQFQAIDPKANTVALRLHCEKDQPSKSELQSFEAVVARLNEALYDPNQDSPDSYSGSLEEYEILPNEIRVHLTAPDCDRLIAHITPVLRALPWPGAFQVVKRRGEYLEEDVPEEYVRI